MKNIRKNSPTLILCHSRPRKRGRPPSKIATNNGHVTLDPSTDLAGRLTHIQGFFKKTGLRLRVIIENAQAIHPSDLKKVIESVRLARHHGTQYELRYSTKKDIQPQMLGLAGAVRFPGRPSA